MPHPYKNIQTQTRTSTPVTIHEQIQLMVKAQEEGWKFHQNIIPRARTPQVALSLSWIGSHVNRTVPVPCLAVLILVIDSISYVHLCLPFLSSMIVVVAVVVSLVQCQTHL